MPSVEMRCPRLISVQETRLKMTSLQCTLPLLHAMKSWQVKVRSCNRIWRFTCLTNLPQVRWSTNLQIRTDVGDSVADAAASGGNSTGDSLLNILLEHTQPQRDVQDSCVVVQYREIRSEGS